MKKGKFNILVAPLDWGLGHAMRCIPLIRELLKSGFNVILAADGRSFDLLRDEFPELKATRLPGHKVTYPRKGSFLKMLRIVPAFYRTINKEHQILQELIQQYNLHAVISDNRYGLYSRRIQSVFIGHQMMIKMPGFLKWAEWFIHKINLHFINRFTECWLPDYQKNDALSGDLSHKFPLPAHCHFIGPLSRFNSENNDLPVEKSAKNKRVLVILSGPEPQRSILENKLLDQLQSIDRKTTVVRGVTEQKGTYDFNANVRIIHHANTALLRQLIAEAEVIVCRSGYSSIMDLAATGRKAIFIPTPGQTEQEYLAKYFYQKQIFYYDTQESINLTDALEFVQNYPGIQKVYNPDLLRNRIASLFNRMSY